MPHVTFGETYPTRRSYDESRALARLPDKGRNEDISIIRRRSRTISYKYPEEKPKQPEKCADDNKTCIERKTTYRDGRGNIIKIAYEDSCGNVTKTIYPTLPPAPDPPKCRSPSPKPPPKCSTPPVSEPSNIPSEDVRNCNWTKIVVKNSRGVIWKIVHVNCYGKTMKTEYPECEPEPYRRRSSETRRYVVKELNESPPRRRYSETKKIVVEKDTKSSSDSKVSTKESEANSSTQKSSSDTTSASKRDSGVGSNGSGRDSGEFGSDVLKGADEVTRRVTRTYIDSRGRRRTVVYDD